MPTKLRNTASEGHSTALVHLPMGRALLFPTDGGSAITAALLVSASVQAMVTVEQVEALAAVLDGTSRLMGFLGAIDVPAEIPQHLVRASPSACQLSSLKGIDGVSADGLRWMLEALGACGLVHVVDHGSAGQGVVPTMPASWPTGVQARHRERIAALVREGEVLRMSNE